MEEDVTRDDWIIGGLALLLLIDLLVFPWRSITPAQGELGANQPTVHESFAAIKSPVRGMAILAAITLVVLMADLVVQHGVHRRLPAIAGSRRTTRLVLAVLVAIFMALQFVLYLHFSQFGWGFYLGVILVILLVLACARASRGAPLVPATGG